MKDGKHRFAFFASLGAIAKKQGTIFQLQDAVLEKRIVSILRMKSGDAATFFDGEHIAEVTFEEISKKRVLCRLISIQTVQSYTPKISCLLPLLKRDALEEAVSRLTILGVSEIQLLVSEKSRQSITEKEFVRLSKVSVAAAEQSKQFSLPVISKPVLLKDFLPRVQGNHLFLFDQHGASSRSIFAQKYSEPITVAFGPEGDFTNEEKALFREHNFASLLLTESVLRTIDAVLLGVGLFRLK